MSNISFDCYRIFYHMSRYKFHLTQFVQNTKIAKKQELEVFEGNKAISWI